MKPQAERMAEFVAYHKNGDGECNGILLKAYADSRNLAQQERYDLAVFYSITYCIPSAIIMLAHKQDIVKAPRQWAQENRPRLIFQSDRRYARLNGNFEKMLQDYVANHPTADTFLQGLTVGNTVRTQAALQRISTWYFFGRFSSFLFLETLCLLMGYKAQPAKMDWQNGDTATSGILNLFCLDKSADYFDKHDKLPPSLTTAKLDTMLSKVIFEITKAGGETNVTEIETSLCAYRKFYKGSRYNGYYLDRQLEELLFFQKQPETQKTVKELFVLRQKLFDHKYLGEVGGWKGVRKECKTLYKRTGKVM